MRAFIILSFVAIAFADKLGYNYRPVPHADSGLSFNPGAATNLASINAAPSNLAQSYDPQSNSDSSYSTAPSNTDPSYSAAPSNAAPSYSPASSGATPSYSAPSFTGPSSSAPSYSAPEPAQTAAQPSYSAPAELEKEFFTYSANDDDFNEPASSDQIANSLKKSLRVVFIKGPENNGLENAALGLAKYAGQQETAIYVLNKQADIGDLANKLNAIRNDKNNKPEVHFVKYRTPEDAQNAQNAIQKQYDSLGGRSQSYDGGVAPALNFASQPAPAPAPAASAPASSYLPASIFRRI